MERSIPAFRPDWARHKTARNSSAGDFHMVTYEELSANRGRPTRGGYGSLQQRALDAVDFHGEHVEHVLVPDHRGDRRGAILRRPQRVTTAGAETDVPPHHASEPNRGCQ